MSAERQRTILQNQIDDISMGVQDLKDHNGENFTIKQLVRLQKSLEAKLAKLNDTSRKDDVVTFEKTKLEVNYISKEADKMWKTGKGLKDGKLRPKKCFIAGCLMLYALKLSTELKSKTDTLTQNANKPCDRKYFEYQRECVELLGTNIFNKTKEICSSNFSNINYGTKGLFLGTPEEEQSFKKCLEQINMNENYVNTFYSIDKLLKSYAELTNNWTPENNALHKREYTSKASVS